MIGSTTTDLGIHVETAILRPVEAVLGVHQPFPRIRGLTCPWAQTVRYTTTVYKQLLTFFAALGSIRSPSAAQGIFGMRPTLGAANTTGVVPYSSYVFNGFFYESNLLTSLLYSNWDTVGGFARTAAECKSLAQALYGSAETEGKIHEVCNLPTASHRMLIHLLRIEAQQANLLD